LGEESRLRVLENRVLRKTFGLKRDQIPGEWRKTRIQELYDLYSSPNTIRMIKSRRMRWVWHVARTEDRRGPYRVLLGEPRERGEWEDLDVYGKIILAWTLKKLDGGGVGFD